MECATSYTCIILVLLLFCHASMISSAALQLQPIRYRDTNTTVSYCLTDRCARMGLAIFC